MDVTPRQGDPGTVVRAHPRTGVVQTGPDSLSCEDQADSDTQQPHSQPGEEMSRQQAPASNIINQYLKFNILTGGAKY